MKYSLKDIPIREVLEQQQRWNEENKRQMETGELGVENPWTYEVLGKKYGSEKLVFKKMEQLADQDYLEYGVSLRTAWLTQKGLDYLRLYPKDKEENGA